MSNFEIDPQKRFSNRVKNYVKYRPKYPGIILDFIKHKLNLQNENIVADIGSGTGISSELFLKNGNTVYGVEPNKDMRETAEKLLKDYPNFISVNGTAESTTLKSKSIDFIVSAQSFHWFNLEKSKEKFLRILQPPGYVILLWNSRVNDASLFLSEYEDLLLKYAIDYKQISHKNIDGKILDNFFNSYEVRHFPNSQTFDFEGLKGRLLSSSYTPTKDHANYKPMIGQLKNIFERNNKFGKVEFIYNTELYFGRLE